MALSPGTKAGSWWGDFYVSADGDYYYHPDVWYFMTYDADGSASYNHFNGGTGYCHYMITDSSGASHSVYCMESGADFASSDGGYTAQSSTDSTYYKRLPAAAQRGIELTTLYGWKPGASLPVSGINADDYKFATQILIWEYQQQLRSDPNSHHNNGSVPADQFYGTLKGRPAEKAYNWILNQIKSHSTLLSFTSSTADKAQTIELKWDDSKKVYTAAVSDSNKVNVDFEILSGSGVTVSRSGNSYTFTAKKMIENPVTFKFRKNIKNADDMLIWGRPGYQTLLTGAKDSVAFYAKIKTETFGTAKIIKTSEDGVIEGISFKITGNNTDITVKTDKDGTISTQLLPGSYTVTELPNDKYVSQPPQNVTITSGKTSTVTFSNVLKKFRAKATKIDSDTNAAQGDATLAGARYGLFDSNKQVATFTTEADFSFETPYYVCGDNWTIKELSPSTGYLLSDAVYSVGAEAKDYELELNTAKMTLKETVVKGDIRLIKHVDKPDPDVLEAENGNGETAGMAERPEAGATFEIYLKSAGSYDKAKDSERNRITTDKDGYAVSKKLPYGHYTVHQVTGEDGKTFMSDFTVFICKNDEAYSYIIDNPDITARVKVEKRDADTGKIISLPGTGFQIKDLSTGKLITQKIYYPNPETATPDEAALQYKDSKDNTAFMRLLKGAVFDLYEDSNADGKFDDDDKLLGQLTEVHDGYHTADNLLVGGYFVREQKAPEGYKLDENAYYFAITEDGQVAVIENGEAGRGFTNEAQRGNLKIVKDSSDGRKDGFAIEVKSKDGTYCETFTTPMDGIIEVNGLRTGTYTVTEIANRASRDYIIPDAATVEIKADENATVQLFNEKPDTPQETSDQSVPQTRDNSLIYIYSGVLIVSVLGGIVFFLLRSRKAKRGTKDKNFKKVNIIVILLCAALAFTSAMMIYRDFAQYKDGAAAYTKLYHSVATADSAEQPAVSDTNEETPPSHIDPQAEHTRISPETISVDFDALNAEAPDVIGWLYQKDTVINYPVVQCDDNDYYLSHLFDGTPNKVGSLFADFENKPDFSDKNTIVYGHNMRDRSMLATLNYYAEQSYFEENPKIYLDTLHGGYSIEIFSAFLAKPSESDTGISPWRLDFKDDGAFSTWVAKMAERSVIKTGVEVTGSDKVLTLSTCNADGSQRFIVMGKLVQK